MAPKYEWDLLSNSPHCEVFKFLCLQWHAKLSCFFLWRVAGVSNGLQLVHDSKVFNISSSDDSKYFSKSWCSYVMQLISSSFHRTIACWKSVHKCIFQVFLRLQTVVNIVYLLVYNAFYIVLSMKK